MKKINSILICCLLLLNLVMPLQAMAEDKGSSITVEQAIRIVEKSLNIKMDAYDIKSSYAANVTGKSVWILNMTSLNDGKGTYNISIDAKTSDIIGFDRVVSDNNKYGKIPKYTKANALEAAINFIKILQPKKYEDLKLKETKDEAAKKYNFSTDIYNFKFTRLINKIEYEDNGMCISVNKNNLAVTNYSMEWDDIDFADPKEAIKLEEAKISFADNIGLQLNYYSIFRYDLQKNKTALVYSLKKSAKPIDALTGGAISISYKDTVQDDSLSYTTDKKFKNYAVPSDKNKIEAGAGYISKQSVYDNLNSMLALNGKYKISDANIYTQINQQNPVWYVKLVPITIDKTNTKNSVLAESDAVTGEVRCFTLNTSDADAKKDSKQLYNREQSRKLAEEFIRNIVPKRFTEISYETATDDTSTVFNFTRKVNDIPFPFDGISINVSPYSGKITSFNMNWSNILLPTNDNVMNIDDAYNNLFKKLNFKLKYIKYKNFKSGETEIKLAYVLDDYSGLFDAKTGKLLDYNCEDVKEATPIVFKDINDIPAEENIKLLTEMGVIELDSNMFMPENKVSQKEFIKLLMRTFGELVQNEISYDNDKTDFEYYYDMALKNKIIAASEKAPDMEVSREEASKMVIRALQLGYVAELDNIYNLPFNDADKIDNKYAGYVSLVSQLKIINPVNLCFYPKATLTKADTAEILVNYLKVNPNVKE